METRSKYLLRMKLFECFILKDNKNTLSAFISDVCFSEKSQKTVKSKTGAHGVHLL